ncbi:hypothetical protein MHBO_002523 [Bonamia ostreae]|uniref:Uncharacterized protein n=1 Tax=Bonamia ostreae TaxID=126728 RepID=A0ABV2AMM5_9EUKA
MSRASNRQNKRYINETEHRRRDRETENRRRDRETENRRRDRETETSRRKSKSRSIKNSHRHRTRSRSRLRNDNTKFRDDRPKVTIMRPSSRKFYKEKELSKEELDRELDQFKNQANKNRSNLFEYNIPSGDETVVKKKLDDELDDYWND